MVGMYPAHIDGRTVAVIRRTTFGYAMVESGRLSYDGQTLSLESEDRSRSVTDQEVASLQLVTPGNRIAATSGFDFFLLLD